MDGLLSQGFDPSDQNLALSQGLLGLGAGLLSGSYGHYGAFAPALSSGATGFQQGYQGALDNALKLRQWRQQQLLQQAQIGNYNSEIAQRQAAMEEQNRLRAAAQNADLVANNRFGTPQGAPMGNPAAPMGGTALGGGSGVVGGGAGFGATGTVPPTAATGVTRLPTELVTGKYASNLLNPDWHLARAEALYQAGDRKGAEEAAKRAQELRSEERNLTKDDQDKPVEGLPGFTFNPKSGAFKKDGTPVTADAVLKAKADLAAASRPQVHVETHVSTEKKYGEQFAGKIAESDSNLRDAAIKAPEMAQRANQIRELIASGKVITGAGADFRLALGKAMNLVGASDQETISNTEGLFADLASTTLDSIKTSGLGSGQGFTNTDRDFLERAKAGKISLEASTLNKLAELNHKAAVATAAKWNDRVKMIPDSALAGTGLTKDPISVPPLYGANKMGPKSNNLSPTERQELEVLRKRFAR